MSVGNDVVDLASPETTLATLHPRFDERVFSAAERAALDASPSRHRLHWTLWAAKESAHKARKRLAPDAVFSPRELEIDLPSLPVSDGVAMGRAIHRGLVFDLEVRFQGASVHALATSDDEAGATLLWEVEETRSDPGVAARELAARAIGLALGVDPTVLRIAGRPPIAIDSDRGIAIDVSLSHHGRFVAFACALAARR